MSALAAEQLARFHRISRLETNLKKKGAANITREMVEVRLTQLSVMWSEYKETHEELGQISPSELQEAKFDRNDHYETTSETYMDQWAALHKMLSSFQQPADETPAEQRPRPALPKIQIPTFNGSYSDWSAFHDLFDSLIIKETSLNNVARLHYLKGCVTGEAALQIKNIATTEANFERAWKTLKERYENKRLLVRAQLVALDNLPTVQKTCASSLKRLFFGTWDVIGALSELGRPVTNATDWIIHVTVERLDRLSRNEWEKELGGSTEPPSLDTLKKFLEARIQTVEALDQSDSSLEPRTTAAKYAKVHQVATSSQGAKGECELCKRSHYLLYCPIYLRKTPSQRRAVLLTTGRCLNCLGKHTANACFSAKRCQKCAEPHHTTIHEAAQPQETALVQHVLPKLRQTVLLGTARVRTFSTAGQDIVIRALIDPGSEVSLISDSLVQRLGLRRHKASVPLGFVGGSSSRRTRGLVSLQVAATQKQAVPITVTAFALANLSSYKPNMTPQLCKWSHLQGLTWADAAPDSSDPVELLLGADVYNEVLLDGIRRGTAGAPVAQETRFGWIVTGGVSDRTASKLNTTVHFCSVQDDLTKLLERFWEQEEVASRQELRPDELECEQHFLRTHQRTTEGRYMVRLPFKSQPELGDSRQAALRVLGSMQRRFARNELLKGAYHEFLREYEDLGHMTVARNPPTSTSYYLPHHGVIKDSSTTTKLRVVSNGSMPTSSGKSLNDCLHTGANLLPALADVLLRWRVHPIAFVADIEKMYRQVVVHPDDRDYQRILWQEENKKLREYKLNTVTYGLACAPYLALRCIQQLATDEADRYPLAAQVCRNDIYVDDILTGASTIEQALMMKAELSQLTTAGGFHLHKWASNHPEFHQDSRGERSTRELHWDTQSQHRVLGIEWNSHLDIFQVRLLDGLSNLTTKRIVTSQIAQIFDPLGWLAPTTIRAKIFIQTLWLTKISWDDALPKDEALYWRKYIGELSALQQIRLPRWLGPLTTAEDVELRGFCDASERAYSAVIYLRYAGRLHSGRIQLVMAKTKVAPLKKVSLPRLELCGAHLLARLTVHIQDTLAIKGIAIHLWSDSLVVLGWIQAHSSRWQTYVANRVAEIQRLVPHAVWHHVRGMMNPADCASRGLSPKDLPDFSLWWSGPEWLSRSNSWTLEHDTGIESAEERAPTVAHIQTPAMNEVSQIIARFSSLLTLHRVFAWCCRWLPRYKNRRGLRLTAGELRDAQVMLIRVEQKRCFQPELSCLHEKRELPPKSRLRKLNPFLDQEGILRVGGRLAHAPIPYLQQHPAILSSDSALTGLWVNDAHKRSLHGGVQLTLSTLRQTCWVLNGRRTVKTHIHRCITCIRWKGKTTTQLMGELPSYRVTPGRAFIKVGVDYAGPVNILASRGRGQRASKGYLAIFICMVTRAVHLEAVSDGSTEAFLAALRRLVARRGRCCHLFSDCGTTFVGADRELQALAQTVNPRNNQLIDASANKGIEWHFNAPAAPHFGGLWEAAVKSVKHHLRRTLGGHLLTFEELSTLLAEIEACLNSRPLQPLSDDPEDLQALTPGHFLVGEAPINIQEESLIDVPMNRLSRWQFVQQRRQQFWRLWARDYLNALQTRNKWTQASVPVSVGDLCLMKGENQPPSRWPLARITAIYPGSDGVTRVVDLRTATSTFSRPLAKIVLLPLHESTAHEANTATEHGELVE